MRVLRGIPPLWAKHQPLCASRFAGYKRPKRVEILSELQKNVVPKALKRVLRELPWKNRERRVRAA